MRTALPMRTHSVGWLECDAKAQRERQHYLADELHASLRSRISRKLSARKYPS
jgi:hypothetical protein